mmetsp:Transcript_136808/g.248813  ORF Transcript_136808/g.248813 Transcript_136808/m.248813 type:complete len:478 (-) Transcript_136808:37-1470(-)
MRKASAGDEAKSAEWKPLVLQPPVLVLIMLGAGGIVFFSATSSGRSDELRSTTQKPPIAVFDSRRLRKAELDDPYTLQDAPAANMQRDLQVRDILGMDVECFREQCSAELKHCHANGTCRVALRHYTRGCWTKMQPLCDELIEAGLIKACPESFEKLYSCFRNASCGSHQMNAMQRHHAYLYRDKQSVEARQDVLNTTDSLYKAYTDHVAGTASADAWPSHWAVAVDSSGSPSRLVGHKVGFNVSVFRHHSPELLEQLTQIAEEADRLYDWGVWTQLRNLGLASPKVRCVELREYGAWDGDWETNKEEEESKRARKQKRELSDWSDWSDWSEWNDKVSDWFRREFGKEVGNLTYGWHCDDSSMVTMAVVLSQTEDFKGGQFTQHANHLCGPEVVYDLKPGDVLVWEAWRNHNIMPVTSGHRKVLLVELWEHPDAVDPREHTVDVDRKKNEVLRDHVLRPEHQAWMSERRWFLKHLLH